MIPKFITTLCALVATTTLLAIPSAADDWPFFRGPNLDGISAEAAWKTSWPESGPPVAWKAEVGIGCASIVTTGDRVITMGNRDDEDVVSCYHADDGRVLWTHAYPCKFEKRMFMPKEIPKSYYIRALILPQYSLRSIQFLQQSPR